VVAANIVTSGLPIEVQEHYLSNKDQIPGALLRGFVLPSAEVVKLILTSVKAIAVLAIAGKKTADCFADKLRYYYRDGNLDLLLPADQLDQPEGQFSVQSPSQPATFKEVVESYLGVTGEISVLAKVLKERGCITTLPVIESLIERQEAAEDVDLRTDSWANFFFVEDRDEGVSVVHVDRNDRQWYVNVNRLGYAYQWSAENRFFFRNPDTGSL